MFADTRKLDNNITHLVDLMSCAARFGVFTHHRDMVIGIAPRRMKFFSTVFNSKPVSKITQYDALNGASVVSMHACGMDDETNILHAWQNIYKDYAGLNFSNRYLFNRHNFIPFLDFKLSSENFIRMVNNIPLKIDVKIPFRLYQTKSKKADKTI